MKIQQIYLLFTILLFLLPSPAASQAPPSSSDPNNLTGDFSPSMGVIVIVLIAALFFMGFFSIYIRHCSDDESPSTTARRISVVRSRRSAPRGLDREVIETFPTFDYGDVKKLKIGKGALECAVCLNEFEDDETLRLIPICDHVFHPECIDAWLAAHTTCPVCRADLEKLGLGLVEAQAHEEEAQEENDVVAVDVVGEPVGPTESMEQRLRLNRSRTRWFGKFGRSNSTGHVAVKQWENMERFTLRLPDEVRRQVMSGKLNRTTSCVVLPREGSSRRGTRFGSGRFERTGRSERWVFSLTPPFFSRAPSAYFSGSLRSTKAADSVHNVDEPKLPPV